MPVNLRRREEQEARDAGSTEDFNWLKDFPLFTRGKCVLRVLSYSHAKGFMMANAGRALRELNSGRLGMRVPAFSSPVCCRCCVD